MIWEQEHQLREENEKLRADNKRLREALRDVAERQREACAIYLAKVCNDYGMQPDCLCSPADEVLRATPLVTDNNDHA